MINTPSPQQLSNLTDDRHYCTGPPDTEKPGLLQQKDVFLCLLLPVIVFLTRKIKREILLSIKLM